VRAALDRGQACAQALRARGQIVAAALVCQHHARLVSGHTVGPSFAVAEASAP